MLATKHIGEQYTSWSVSCEREVAQEHQSRPPVEAAWPFVSPASWVVAVGASRLRPASLRATVREGRHGANESGRYSGMHELTSLSAGLAESGY